MCLPSVSLLLTGCGNEGQAFRQATTPTEGGVPALNMYLIGAGLATTRILVHEVDVIQDGPGDTVKSSVRSQGRFRFSKKEKKPLCFYFLFGVFRLSGFPFFGSCFSSN